MIGNDVIPRYCIWKAATGHRQRENQDFVQTV